MTAAPLSPPFPRRWLRDAGRSHRRALGLAALITTADVLPAVGFASGLALTLTAWPDRSGMILIGLVVMMASLLVRGLVSQQAANLGAGAAARIKGEVRRGVVTDLFAGLRPGGGGLIAAVEGVDRLEDHYARFEPARMAAVFAPVLVLIAIAMASPVSALILALTLIPFGMSLWLAGTAAAAESRKQFQALEALSGLFLDRIRALPAIAAFQASDAVASEVERASGALAGRTARVLRIAFLSSGILEFFSALAVALVAVYCGFQLLDLMPVPIPEPLDLGRAVFALVLAPEVYAPLRRMAAAYHDRQAAEAVVPTLARRDSPAPLPAPHLGKAPAVIFRKVGIAYGETPPVISGFDLEVRPGQVVALTGASGTGKSSLLHLFLGLSPLTEGEVEIDGHPLSRHGDWCGQIGWMGQTTVVVPGTLAENIALSRTGAWRAVVAAVAGQAGLNLDLDRRIDERGGGLSGGERRRLALARAMLKQAPLLLLDEPTAHLDAEAEAALIPALAAAIKGRTCLIATHSRAVMALADRVVAL